MAAVRGAFFVSESAMWEHFHHQADIGVRGIGATPEEAFEEGAYALMAVMCSPQKVRPRETVEIAAEVEDRELLFAEWLNQIIYEIDTRRMLFCRFKVTIDGDRLSAQAIGEKTDPERHELSVEVKAATYQMLKVAKEGDCWIAQCVVDV